MSTKAIPATATPRNLLLGAGAIYYNYGEVTEAFAGATKGGSVFNVEREIVEIEQDGSYGAIKGLKKKNRIHPILTINLLELNTTNLPKMYAGLSVSTTNPSYDVVTENVAIATGDYLSNIAFVGNTVDGEDIVIIVKNALGDGNIEWTMENKESVVPETVFTGHYASDAITTVPYEIRFPKTITDAVLPTATCVPTGGATGVSRAVSPVITFSEAVRTPTLTNENIYLVKTSDYSRVTTATLSWNAGQTVVTMNTGATLAASSQYLLVIGTGVKDIVGNSILFTTFAFTTGT